MQPRRPVIRVSLALVGGVLVNALIILLVFGPSPFGQGLLEHAVESVYRWIDDRVNDAFAFYVVVLALALPGLVTSAMTHAWLSRATVARDGEIHCRRCDYILRGITEPRCPECGERI